MLRFNCNWIKKGEKDRFFFSTATCSSQSFHILSPMKNILVTGGNSGIGLALCKLLVTGHGCHVYMGSRDVGRGKETFYYDAA